MRQTLLFYNFNSIFMKKIYLFAALAAMLAACSENDLTAEKQVVQQNAEEGAVTFDVYTQRTTTRAGEIGSLTTDGLKTGNFKEEGFGVFGYYTNNATYDQQAVPNFFYNEQVKWNGSFFEYSPIKYWPNEYGNTAESEDADKVSFFAYAPYVPVSPSTGKAVDNMAKPNQEESANLQKWGITTLSNNSATGDPLVKYIVSFDQDKSVDLCWGVCDGTDTQWPTVATNSTSSIQELQMGKPWIDVQRPAEAKTQDAANQKVRFTFKHATAQLMVKINAFVDGTDNSNAIAENTKVFVRSITFEGFATKGALNLNNTETGKNKAYWMDWTGTNDIVTGESVTIYDGRKDGKEGTPSGEATNEKTLGLNPTLVQSDLWANSAEGVTKDLKNLFRKYDESTEKYVAADKPVYVIPTGDNVRVTITYDIETKDDKLSTYVSDVTTHGSSIENVISKDITFGSEKLTALENGKSYVINLHLGMNSVKFDAAVTDWVEAETVPDVDLPSNVPQFKSTSEGTTYSVDLPATTTEYTFAITGLNGGEAITAPDVADPVTARTENAANSSGVAIETITLKKNMTPNDIDGVDFLWKGVSSGNKATLKIAQKAHALELKIASVSGKDITLDAGATVTWASDVDATTLLNNDKDAIKVWRNGSRMLYKGTTDADGQFKWDANENKIILHSAVVPGETYTVYVKAGDAEGETVTVHIGGTVLPAPATTPVPLEYGDTYQIKPTFYGAEGVDPGWTWTPTSGSYISVDDYGVVSTNGVTDEPQTVTLKTSAKTAANGWVYDTSDRTYQVKVTKAAASISFTIPEPGTKAEKQDRAVNSVVLDNKAVLRNSHDAILTEGADKGGTIAYSVVSVTGGTGTTDQFTVTDDGVLKVRSGSTISAGSYTVTVKAKVTAPTSPVNAGYGTDEVTYTIKFTTQP